MKFFQITVQFGPVRGFQITSVRLGTAHGRGVAQSGSAPVLGTGGREFESRRPDHLLIFSQILAQVRVYMAREIRQLVLPPCAVWGRAMRPL